MKEVFYKCTLKTDIVLNAALVTDGNMETLDYIPGSNFLGIVANDIYLHHPDKAYNILHSNNVSFGDATISTKKDSLFFSMPLIYYQDKIKNDIEADPVYIDILLDPRKDMLDPYNKKQQLKQKRNGYISPTGVVVENIEKSFALKSAYERETRSSKEGAMFGFESIKAGQEFIFSILYAEENDIEIVDKYINGDKRIGKSKSSQYGQVHISKIDSDLAYRLTFEAKDYEGNDCTLVYAESNLCFIDERTGQSTFQPTSEQMGFDGCEIDYARSRIRTYSYSPWNGKRNTTNGQRHCIGKGSVFVIAGKHQSNLRIVGEYQAEGLGRIKVNPKFLEGNNDGISILDFKNFKNEGIAIDDLVVEITLPVSKYLQNQKINKDKELNMTKEIHSILMLKDNECLMQVSPSQWGGIRTIATSKFTIEEVQSDLFDTKVGYLTNGVSYERIWSKNRDQKLNKLKAIIELNKQYGPAFLAKLAAEFAKISKADDHE